MWVRRSLLPNLRDTVQCWRQKSLRPLAPIWLIWLDAGFSPLHASISVWSVRNSLLHSEVWFQSVEPDRPRLNPFLSLSPVLALTSVETLLQSELFNHLYKQSILLICWFHDWEFAYNLYIPQNWYSWWLSSHSNSRRAGKTLSPQMHELPPEVEQGIRPLRSHTVNQYCFLRYL